MNDIGGSWDRRGEFLVIYNANTKELNAPCEITTNETQKHNAGKEQRRMYANEIDEIVKIFNSVRTPKTGSPESKKNDSLLAAQESVKMGKPTEFTYNGFTYKITPLKVEDTAKVAKLKELADSRKEKETVHLVKVNPNTPSSKRTEAAATLSRNSTTSPTTQAPKPPHAKPAERLPHTSWMRFDRYLGFRQDKKIESNFFEVKLKNEVVTDSTKLDAIENALSTNPEMKTLSDAMRKGNDVEITIGKTTYQLTHVNHSTTPPAENKKIFALVESREKWLFNKIMSGPRPAEIEKALTASSQEKSVTPLRAAPPPPSAPPRPPRISQSVTQNTTQAQSVSNVSQQIIAPTGTGTVARRPAPSIPQDPQDPPQAATISKGTRPLPPPPVSPKKAASPTAAPRPDLWSDKKTAALLDKFILFNGLRPIHDKDLVGQILKEHYDALPREERELFDTELKENEIIKIGGYSLIPKK
ncbi:MAG: hypothetical protein LLF94_10455 [Chlamydiales bacterium]|nr:hypothetical protein [Chlamydiales bacterium]